MDNSEYIIEFYSVGNAVKVTAVDPATGIEVSMVGDPSVGKKQLTRLAVQKLEYVLKKRQGETA
jgi:hypothetical protein